MNGTNLSFFFFFFLNLKQKLKLAISPSVLEVAVAEHKFWWFVLKKFHIAFQIPENILHVKYFTLKQIER